MHFSIMDCRVTVITMIINNNPSLIFHHLKNVFHPFNCCRFLGKDDSQNIELETKIEDDDEEHIYEELFDIVVNSRPNLSGEKIIERYGTVTGLLNCKDDETKLENSSKNLEYEKPLDVIVNSSPNVSRDENIERHETVTGLFNSKDDETKLENSPENLEYIKVIDNYYMPLIQERKQPENSVQNSENIAVFKSHYMPLIHEI